MPLNRREFLQLTVEGAVVTTLLSPLGTLAASQSRFKAVAFDAFPIFDPRPIFGLAETLFPGKGAELSNAWRTRQFEYQWLRALAGRYADFWQTTEDRLVFARKFSLRRSRDGTRLVPNGLATQRSGSIVRISQAKNWGSSRMRRVTT